jgi:hypothetical protein
MHRSKHSGSKKHCPYGQHESTIADFNDTLSSKKSFPRAIAALKGIAFPHYVKKPIETKLTSALYHCDWSGKLKSIKFKDEHFKNALNDQPLSLPRRPRKP